MSELTEFLDRSQEQEIISAIKSAEMNTSGEIRVHIEGKTDLDAFERGMEVFYSLEMHKTAQRNGVLIYIAVESRKFAILGDQGINEKVGENFWETEKKLLLTHFKNKAYATGICKVVFEVGQKLKAFFPYQTNDENELTDEISKG